ncbi:hypothetical protein N1851_034113 [Merluccius polli]|uniref:Uncharacterized protein n=1 Tax=Merluccius polli TaxID=89951 RepID=A0AA47M026_MERPO|nr:hypothetical protein N1851_034113 [Merluccius polli]
MLGITGASKRRATKLVKEATEVATRLCAEVLIKYDCWIRDYVSPITNRGPNIIVVDGSLGAIHLFQQLLSSCEGIWGQQSSRC